MARQRVEILVSDDSGERALAIDYEATATVRDLAAALGPDHEELHLYLERSGRTLEPSERLTDIGLARGDRILRDGKPIAEPLPAGSIDLIVVGGPAAGLRFTLQPGVYTLGRGSTCDLQVRDPLLSRQHARLRVTPTELSIGDLGSRNGSFVDGSPLTSELAVGEGAALELGGSVIRVTRHEHEREGLDGPPLGEARAPAREEARVDREFVVPPPPARTERRPLSMAIVLVPLLLAAIAFSLFPRDGVYLSFLLLVPVAALATMLDRAGAFSRGELRAQEGWRLAVTATERQIERSIGSVRTSLERSFPDPLVLERRAVQRKGLWERRPGDGDHGLVRVGRGDAPSGVTIRTEPGGDLELRRHAEERMARFDRIDGAPFALSLRADGPIGLIGDRDRMISLARWLIVQIAVQQSPEEMEVSCILGEELDDERGWLRWLPHCRQTMLDRTGHLVSSEQVLQHCLARLGSERKTEMLVVVDGSTRIRRDGLTRLLTDGPARGVFVVWLAPDRPRLPARCRTIVHLPHAGAARVERTGASLVLDADGMSSTTTMRIAQRLAPLVAGIERVETPIAEALGLRGADDIVGRWKSAPELRCLAGTTDEGPVILDLSEGPILIEGVPGPERTRLLESVVLSLAAGVSPEEVSLVLVGRGNGCLEELPHVAAVISDDEERLADEARDFLRRQDGPATVFVVPEAQAGSLSRSIGAITARALQDERARGIHVVMAGRHFELPGREGAGPTAGFNLLRLEEHPTVGASGATLNRDGPVLAVDLLDVEAPVASDPVLVHDLDHQTSGRSRSLLAAIRHAAQRNDTRARSLPWAGLLPDRVDAQDLPRGPRRFALPLGLADDRGSRTHRPFFFDLEEMGSLLIYGGPQSGKTTSLKTLVEVAARFHRPDELHLYAIGDAGDLGLIDAFPHVGCVVPVADVAQVDRLFAMIAAKVERDRTEPRVVVFIDGYESFEATFERIDSGRLVDDLPRLVAQGPEHGVHFVITGARPRAIPATITASAATNVILRMSTLEEHVALGAPESLYRYLVPGRGIVDRSRELQVAEPSGPRGMDLEGRWGNAKAPTPSALPSILIQDRTGRTLSRHADLGLGENGSPAVVDLTARNFLVAGPHGSGRTTTLQAMACSLLQSSAGSNAFLVSPRGRVPDGDWSDVAVEAPDVDRLLEDLDRDLGAPLTFLFVDDLEALHDPAHLLMERLVKRSRDGGLRIIASGDAHAMHRTFAGWLTDLREERTGLLLNPRVEIDGDLFGLRLPRRSTVDFPPGRGYLIQGAKVTLIQVAQPAWRF